MAICAKCHELDRTAIGCDKKMEQHMEYGMFRCPVCNKFAIVYVCSKYQQLTKRNIQTSKG